MSDERSMVFATGENADGRKVLVIGIGDACCFDCRHAVQIHAESALHCNAFLTSSLIDPSSGAEVGSRPMPCMGLRVRSDMCGPQGSLWAPKSSAMEQEETAS